MTVRLKDKSAAPGWRLWWARATSRGPSQSTTSPRSAKGTSCNKFCRSLSSSGSRSSVCPRFCQQQDGLQLLFRVVGEQGRVGDSGIHLFEDGLRAAGARGRLKNEDVFADGHLVAVRERLTAADPAAIEERAVVAAEILDEIRARFAQDLGVAPTDLTGGKADVGVRLTPDDRKPFLQREFCAGLLSFQNDESGHDVIV